MADRVHELPNDQLRAKLAGGELSDKKAGTARAVIRRRRRKRIQAWLQRHAWVGAIFAAIGLGGFVTLGPGAHPKR
jgi:hypothetical protein